MWSDALTYRANSIEAYASDAAAGKPTPGGGSVSALVGALAAAMSEMTANYTVGKKRFADVRDEVEDALGDLAECREAIAAGFTSRDGTTTRT